MHYDPRRWIACIEVSPTIRTVAWQYLNFTLNVGPPSESEVKDQLHWHSIFLTMVLASAYIMTPFELDSQFNTNTASEITPPPAAIMFASLDSSPRVSRHKRMNRRSNIGKETTPSKKVCHSCRKNKKKVSISCSSNSSESSRYSFLAVQRRDSMQSLSQHEGPQ